MVAAELVVLMCIDIIIVPVLEFVLSGRVRRVRQNYRLGPSKDEETTVVYANDPVGGGPELLGVESTDSRVRLEGETRSVENPAVIVTVERKIMAAATFSLR
ncbi:hypothetical protein OG21DRAFT_1507454 [Imleria badia]|nr:hypothetical protein OG21DRAFT_1507454 [Imleria badia]